MRQEEKPAYIMAMAACANAEIIAMQEANIAARAAGRTTPYPPGDFLAVPEKYGIHHNAVLELLRS